jgi:predicted  nucleic acid-binding Zn-ribbon protein
MDSQELEPGERRIDGLQRGIVDVSEKCAICHVVIEYEIPLDDYEPNEVVVCERCSAHVELHFGRWF